MPALLGGTAGRQTRVERPRQASDSLPGLCYLKATRQVCPGQPGVASCLQWELVASGEAPLSRSWCEGPRDEPAVWETLPDPQARGGPGSCGGPMNPDSDSAEPRTSTGEPRSCCPWAPRFRVLETQTQVTWKSLETWLTAAHPPQAHAMRCQCPAPRFGGGRGGGSRGHSPRTHGWLAAARTCFHQSLLPSPRLGLQPGRSVGPGGLSARSPEFLPHLVGRPSRHLTPTQPASDLQRSTPQALSPAAWVSSPHNPQEVSSQPRPQVASGE